MINHAVQTALSDPVVIDAIATAVVDKMATRLGG